MRLAHNYHHGGGCGSVSQWGGGGGYCASEAQHHSLRKLCKYISLRHLNRTEKERALLRHHPAHPPNVVFSSSSGICSQTYVSKLGTNHHQGFLLRSSTKSWTMLGAKSKIREMEPNKKHHHGALEYRRRACTGDGVCPALPLINITSVSFVYRRNLCCYRREIADRPTESGVREGGNFFLLFFRVLLLLFRLFIQFACRSCVSIPG